MTITSIKFGFISCFVVLYFKLHSKPHFPNRSFLIAFAHHAIRIHNSDKNMTSDRIRTFHTAIILALVIPFKIWVTNQSSDAMISLKSYDADRVVTSPGAPNSCTDACLTALAELSNLLPRSLQPRVCSDECFTWVAGPICDLECPKKDGVDIIAHPLPRRQQSQYQHPENPSYIAWRVHAWSLIGIVWDILILLSACFSIIDVDRDNWPIWCVTAPFWFAYFLVSAIFLATTISTLNSFNLFYAEYVPTFVSAVYLNACILGALTLLNPFTMEILSCLGTSR